MRLIPIALCALALSGCTSMVRLPGKVVERDPYAPVDERTRTYDTGLVKYSADGADFVVESRRKSVYRDMHKACGGDYRIVNEYSSSSDPVATTRTTGGKESHGFRSPEVSTTHITSSTWIYLEFACVSDPVQ